MIRKISSILFFLLSTWMFLSCEAEEFSIQILGVKPVELNDCAPNSVDDKVFVANGLVDVAISGDYTIYLSMTNRLLDSLEVNNLTEKDGRIRTTDVTLSGAIIEYLDPDEVGFGFTVDRREVSFSGLLRSNGGTTLTQAINILTPEMMNTLRSHGAFKGLSENGLPTSIRNVMPMVVSIQVTGKTLDGKDVSSNTITFPITICTGCRVSFQSTEANCDMISEEEEKLLATCPTAIGRDNVFASCALCRQMASREFISLCE